MKNGDPIWFLNSQKRNSPFLVLLFLRTCDTFFFYFPNNEEKTPFLPLFPFFYALFLILSILFFL